jgi:hypothetical protein
VDTFRPDLQHRRQLAELLRNAVVVRGVDWGTFASSVGLVKNDFLIFSNVLNTLQSKLLSLLQFGRPAQAEF